jgi:hypothetical protein
LNWVEFASYPTLSPHFCAEQKAFRCVNTDTPNAKSLPLEIFLIRFPMFFKPVWGMYQKNFTFLRVTLFAFGKLLFSRSDLLWSGHLRYGDFLTLFVLKNYSNFDLSLDISFLSV